MIPALIEPANAEAAAAQIAALQNFPSQHEDTRAHDASPITNPIGISIVSAYCS